MHNKSLMRLGAIVATLMIAVTAIMPGAMRTVHADQALPPYAWYAVLWQQPADTLHWVGPLGEVASIPRPKLPNELVGSFVQLRISPNGRYLVEVASLANSQVQGIGIYDLQAGQFVKTHQAQPGESIQLGHQIFSLASQRVAVGFMSGDYNAPAWRVIVFDLVTGDATAVLDQSSMAPMQLSTPFVRHYGVDESLGEEVIHFQMVPYGVGGGMQYPAYAWMPFPAPANQALALGSSPYTHAESDVRFISGEEVFTYTDPNVPTLPAMGPGPTDNAIGRRIPVNGQDTTQPLWTDGTAWNYQAKWAAGDDWVLYRSDNGQGFANWNVILGDAPPLQQQRKLIAATVTDVAGTPDGYLMVASETFTYYTNNFEDTAGTLIFQGTAGQDLDIVYVTPEGVQFALPSLGEGGGIVANPGEVAPPAQPTCQGTLAPRLTVGHNARVTFTNGAPLNVRVAPGGNSLGQLPEGTVVSVISGPQCVNGYLWWQIQTANVSGWSAEADQANYYLEPWNVAVNGPDGIAAPPSPMPTQPLQIAPPSTAAPTQAFQVAPIPTATPAFNIAANCPNAPQQHVSVGMQVRAAASDGTYAFFTNLTDGIPSAQIQPGTTGTLIGGPSCKNGYRFWQGQFNQGGQTLTGWISEGTQSQYFIDPM